MENKIKIKKIKIYIYKRKLKKKKNIYIYIYIYKSLQLPRGPGVAEAAHSALDASIYRLSSVGSFFNNCIVDSKNYGPNWSLYHDIFQYFTIEF